MSVKDEVASAGYRIGAVAKLTGILPDTLRIWERRYSCVTPQRSPGGGRIYSADDIARLRLMKLLVDRGDSIGAVAMLSHAALQARVNEARAMAAPSSPQRRYRLVVIGEPLAAKMNSALETLPDISLAAAYSSTQAFLMAEDDIEADVLVIEQPTLQAETAVHLPDWIARVNAAHAIVVYRFAAQHTLSHLPRSKCSALRAPVDPKTIERVCTAIMGQRSTHGVSDSEHEPLTSEAAPPRRFTDETLARLATISSTVQCECPRHLAELLTSLAAFEQYSTECESRNAKDAALHAYLNATASRARHMIEIALSQVLEAENIEV
mgnify:FL=1